MSTQLDRVTPDVLAEIRKAHAPVADADGHLVGLETKEPESDRIEYPRIVVVHPMSAVCQDGEAKAGQFYLSMLNMSLGEELHFVPSAVRYRRIRFDKGKLTAPVCTSEDGFAGAGDPGGDCQACDLQSWAYAKSQGLSAPPCQLCYNIFGLLPDMPMQIPLCVSFRSSSARSGRDLVNLLKATATNPWGLTISLYPQEKSNDKGRFYVIRWKPSGLTPPDLAAAAQRIAATLPAAAVPFEDEERTANGETTDSPPDWTQ